MPKRIVDPHGNTVASATPRSRMSREAGAEACTFVPPSSVTRDAIVPSEGRTRRPFTSAGVTMGFVVDWK